MLKAKDIMPKIRHLVKKIDKNMALAGIAVIGVIIAGVLIYFNSHPGFGVSNFNFGLGIGIQNVFKKTI